MGTHLLITQDGFKVNEKDNVSWVINNRYAYELKLCEGHKELINNTDGIYKVFKNKENAIKYHDEYLLKNTHIRFESKEEALLYHETEVKRLKKAIEENKPKIGDWCYFYDNTNKSSKVIGKLSEITALYYTGDFNFHRCEKITNPELIKLLEQEIK